MCLSLLISVSPRKIVDPGSLDHVREIKATIKKQREDFTSSAADMSLNARNPTFPTCNLSHLTSCEGIAKQNLQHIGRRIKFIISLDNQNPVYPSRPSTSNIQIWVVTLKFEPRVARYVSNDTENAILRNQNVLSYFRLMFISSN